MTVGTPPGHAGGDLATPTPVWVSTAGEEDSSPEWLQGSRFWVLQSSDDEEDGEEDGEEGEAKGNADSAMFLYRSPTPVSDADLLEGSAELSRRHRKRLKRRDFQRLATRAALQFAAAEGTSSLSLSLPLGKYQGARLKAPAVLEPSVFYDDDVEGWTVVRQRCWSPVSDAKIQDPIKKRISKKEIWAR
jgi:hypothetical protein